MTSMKTTTTYWSWLTKTSGKPIKIIWRTAINFSIAAPPMISSCKTPRRSKWKGSALIIILEISGAPPEKFSRWSINRTVCPMSKPPTTREPIDFSPHIQEVIIPITFMNLPKQSIVETKMDTKTISTKKHLPFSLAEPYLKQILSRKIEGTR